MVRNSERLLGDSHRIAAESSALHALFILPNLAQSLETALEDLTAPFHGAEDEYTFEGMADRPLSESFSASRSPPTYSASYSRLNSTIHQQIPIIQALLKVTVVHLIEDGSRATESSQELKVLFVI